MTLFMFFIGILIILGIARYNESEKLFWTLFISFIGAFTATTAVSKYIDSEKQNNVEVVSPAPTQALFSVSHKYCVLADSSEAAIYEEKSSDPVSKDSLETKLNIILSKVGATARDQPTTPFDTS